MHVEMSLDAEVTEPPKSEAKPVDTQTISGSQVACAIARKQEYEFKNTNGMGRHTLAISIAAVMSVVCLYLVVVLVV